MKTEERSTVFALLDDCDATAERRSSRLYTDFAHERVCVDGHELEAVCAEIEGDLRSGLHAVVVADYEFGRNLQFGKIGRGDDHALRVLMFHNCRLLSRDEVDAWLASQGEDSMAGVAGIAPSVTRVEFDAAIAAAMKGAPRRRSRSLALRSEESHRERDDRRPLAQRHVARGGHRGSVNVPALFSVEPYASVWQMTSTIEARVIPGTSFAGIVRALFPCSSITGAPKYRTMQLIDEIESTPRRLYTGAIGWLDASGDLCLSVAIRTLVVDAAKKRGVLGISAGIVLDSVAADEFEECLLKARFLTGADPGFELFETTYATRGEGVRHYARHVARLKGGAAYLGFVFDEHALDAQVAQHCAGFDAGKPYRLRIALDKSGRIAITSAPLGALPSDTVNVLLAADRGIAPQSSCDPLLRHKTTRRADYDRAKPPKPRARSTCCSSTNVAS